MVNPFDLWTKPQLKPYIQYQKSQGLNDVFNVLSDTIYNNAKEFINEWLNAINIKESQSEFLEFYAKHFLGITRPLSSGVSIEGSTLYDLKTEYDNGFIYDNQVFTKPTIDLTDFLKYLKFIYDYSYETLTLEQILLFIYDWDSKLVYGDVKVDFGDTITIKTPSTSKIENLFNIINVNRNTMGLPSQSVLNFETYFKTESEENNAEWQNPHNAKS